METIVQNDFDLFSEVDEFIEDNNVQDLDASEDGKELIAKFEGLHLLTDSQCIRLLVLQS